MEGAVARHSNAKGHTGFCRYPFVDNPHKSVLAFENGIVNLQTGELEGPAPPDMLITQYALVTPL